MNRLNLGIINSFLTFKLARRGAVLGLALLITIGLVGSSWLQIPRAVQAAIPAGVICAWPSTNASIPTGWSRVTSLDNRFPKQIVTSGTAPGAVGGAATHTPTINGLATHSHTYGDHTHTWPTTGIGANHITNSTNSGTLTFLGDHTHPMTQTSTSVISTDAGPGWSSESLDPPNLNVIFIKSDGTPTGIPVNALTYFNSAAPTGWTAYANAQNRLLKGAGSGADGGSLAGTGDNHTHSMASHTHTRTGAHTHGVTAGAGGVSGNSNPGGGSWALVPPSHTHAAANSNSANFGGSSTEAATDISGNGDSTPPWKKLLVIQNTSGAAALPNSTICMWDGALAAIPAGWFLADGLNSTPNLAEGKYVRGAAAVGELGNIGGSATHTHASGSHFHVDSGAAHSHISPTTGGATLSCSCGANVSNTTPYMGSDHTHAGGSASGTAVGGNTNSTTTVVDSVTNDPLFTGIAYIQFQNQTPNAPTIMGLSPIPGSKPNKDGGNISLQATATDPDSADTVQVDWGYSANSGGAWTNIGTTSLSTQATTQTLSWNISGLSPGSTYRLRVRTLDNNGALSGYTTQGADWTLTSGCSPPTGGDLTLSVSCAFPETTNGVDNGNLTVGASTTLTINAGQTIGINSAKSVTVNGSIAINSTAQMKQSNIWMVDADGDGWSATVNQTIQDSSPGATYRRRNILQSFTTIDCNDAVASASNSC